MPDPLYEGAPLAVPGEISPFCPALTIPRASERGCTHTALASLPHSQSYRSLTLDVFPLSAKREQMPQPQTRASDSHSRSPQLLSQQVCIQALHVSQPQLTSPLKLNVYTADT